MGLATAVTRRRPHEERQARLMPQEGIGFSPDQICSSQGECGVETYQIHDEAKASMKLNKLIKRKTNKQQIKGHIDTYGQGQLQGWAYDPENPDDPVQLKVLVQGRQVAEGTADIYREDLMQSGFGNGKHGFRIRVPLSLNIGQAADVVLLDAESGEKVAAKPFQVKRDNASSILIEALEWSQLTGTVTAGLAGAERLLLTLLVDGTEVSAGVALPKEGSTFTFRVDIPSEWFDGMPHAVTVVLNDEPGVEATWLDVLPAISTPWEYLSSSAPRNGYAALSRVAGFRYESLRLKLDAAAGGEAYEPATVQNLMTAHTVVVEGYHGRKKFPKLVLPYVENPTVSIVIPVHNKFELTYHCLASLILAQNDVSYEVVIVDDCSTDHTVEIESYIENATVVVNERNLGFLLSCNKGVQASRGEFVVMLNNDTEVTSRWLDEMLDVFSRHKGVGMVGSKLLYPDGRLQEAGGIVWSTGEPWNLGNGKNPRHPSYCYTRETDYLSGASMMLSRCVWDEVGGFSEEFAPAYYEDTDLAFKVRQAGYKTLYCPMSEVIHFEGMSNGRDISQGVKKHQATNAPKFRAKWFNAYRHNGKVGEDITINMDRGVAHRVLMIDYSVPRPDQDAGSYAAVQEIRMLQASGCKVTFIAENMAHLGKYTDELQRMGVECIYAPFYTSIGNLLEKRGAEFNLVYITRYDVAERNIEAVRKYTKAKILFNNADLHFLRELRAALAAKQRDLSGPLATRDREFALMRRVDAILSYNTSEHAVIVSHNLRDDNLFLCPWVVDFKGSRSEFEDRHGIAFLGGYRHKPNVEAVQYFVQAVMPLLRRRMPGVSFHIYGSAVPPEVEALEASDVIVEGFVEDLSVVFDNCRIFVAPLLSGAGIKGKVLEAMAYGVPSVLSPVAVEGTGMTNGVSTLVAETPEQWAVHIEQLYRDRAQWHNMSNQLERLAKANFSFERGVQAMQAALSYLGIYSLPFEATGVQPSESKSNSAVGAPTLIREAA